VRGEYQTGEEPLAEMERRCQVNRIERSQVHGEGLARPTKDWRRHPGQIQRRTIPFKYRNGTGHPEVIEVPFCSFTEQRTAHLNWQQRAAAGCLLLIPGGRRRALDEQVYDHAGVEVNGQYRSSSRIWSKVRSAEPG
jgi:hypothetical protein